jgi:hypothetical protein
MIMILIINVSSKQYVLSAISADILFMTYNKFRERFSKNYNEISHSQIFSGNVSV